MGSRTLLSAVILAVSFTVVALPANAGRFSPRGPFPVGDFPEAVAIGDFNSDGIPDLAVAIATTSSVNILLGDGTGGFHKAFNFPVAAPPSNLALGDFDHDGNLDIATANGGDPSQVGNVSVLLGNGDGTFRRAATYFAGFIPFAVVASDFNGDGNLDLAVANAYEYAGGNTITILLGVGDGTFQNADSYFSGLKPAAIAAADFNHDGIPDLVAANYLGASLSVFLGRGDGTFHRPAQYRVESRPNAVALADLNGDGNVDLVVAIFNPDGDNGGVSVLLGAPDGSFFPASYYGTGYSANFFAVALGDLDKDGSPDLVAGDSRGVTILRGQGDGTFGPPLTYRVALPIPIAVAVADLTGNGAFDIVTVSLLNDYVAVLLNNGP